MGAACTVLEGHTAVARGDTAVGIERMRAQRAGQVLVEAGTKTEAAAAHERAIDITDSPSLRARFRAEYGRSLELVGRIADAGASAQRGLREDPGNVHCLTLLDDVRRREAQA